MLAAVARLRQTVAQRDASAQAVGLPLIGLPAYSPELNPAERVFQELRRAIEGRADATLGEQVAAGEPALTEWDADPARVRSLAG